MASLPNAGDSCEGSSSGLPLRTRAVLLWPSCLLLLVAARQMWLALDGELSPWKGGGFGMFAAMDHPGTRFLHCRGVTAAGEAVLVQPGSLVPHLTRKLATFPEQEDLDALCAVVLGAEYIEAGVASDTLRDEFLLLNPQLKPKFLERRALPVKVLTPRDRRKPGHEQAAGYKLASVEISVWRSRFHSGERSLRADLVLGPHLAESTPAPVQPAMHEVLP